MFRLSVFLISIFISTFAIADEKPSLKFSLTSPAFKQEGEIVSKYTCQGGDVNPGLEIANIPKKTKSIALTVHDPDAPEGVWVHWVVYNIPPTKTSIVENTTPGYQALNDFGKYSYSGPCPSDERTHRYVFRLYAVDTVLMIDEGMTMKDLEKVLSGHVIAKTELIGLYRKPVW